MSHTMLLSYIKRIREQCERFSIAEESPMFYERLMTYIDILLDVEDEDPMLDSDEVFHALLEAHTMITLDEDLDGEGIQKLDDLFQFLDIETRTQDIFEGVRSLAVVVASRHS